MNKWILVFFVIAIVKIESIAQHLEIEYEMVDQRFPVFRYPIQLIANEKEFIIIDDTRRVGPFKTKEGYKLEIGSRALRKYLFNGKTNEWIYSVQKKKKQFCYSENKLTPGKWVIHNEFDSILGYKVQKATMTYDYDTNMYPDADIIQDYFGKITAWFACDIPFSVGPRSKSTNLDGVELDLPGAILKVVYGKNKDAITATKVTIHEDDINIHEEYFNAEDCTNTKDKIKIFNKDYW